jgi:tetratricopeptide (TPR) repeat protein
MHVFVSHSHEDHAFCRGLVEALGQAGVDVWVDEDDHRWDDEAASSYDEEAGWDEKALAEYEAANATVPIYLAYDDAFDDATSSYDELDRWNETIASSYDETPASPASPDETTVLPWDDEGYTVYRAYREWVAPRPVFVVLLSQASFASRSVRDTAYAAYWEATGFPESILLAVTAGPIEQSHFNIDNGWLFLAGVKRIEAPGMQPLPLEEAVRRTVETLCLARDSAAPMPVTPQPTESAQDLLVRGNALFAQGRNTEALAFFEQATHRAPESFAAWFNLGRTLFRLKRWSEVVEASERAIMIDPAFAHAWNNLGAALDQLKRSEEGLAMCERALALAPHDAVAWSNKGNALCSLTRYDEALAAYDRALMHAPYYAIAWNNKGAALSLLQRYDEALRAVNQALTLDRNHVAFWDTKGEVLHGLHRDEEALRCFDQALTLDPTDTDIWKNKAVTLRALGRMVEADVAERRSEEELGG